MPTAQSFSQEMKRQKETVEFPDFHVISSNDKQEYMNFGTWYMITRVIQTEVNVICSASSNIC